jgi:hypothetical protein
MSSRLRLKKKKKKWRLKALKSARMEKDERKEKNSECAFQTTLSTLSRSRVSLRGALRARAATLSEGEESEAERGRRRATIRKKKIELK